MSNTYTERQQQYFNKLIESKASIFILKDGMPFSVGVVKTEINEDGELKVKVAPRSIIGLCDNQAVSVYPVECFATRINALHAAERKAIQQLDLVRQHISLELRKVQEAERKARLLEGLTIL